MEKLNFLIYSSVRNAICTDEEIQKILNSCERNNPSKSITGVLVHSNNYFLQFLEGDENELMALYNHIKKDSRHSKVILLNKGTIEGRMFPSWHMGYKDADKDNVTLITDATDNESETFNKLLKGGVIEDSKALKMLSRFYKLV
jgi:hypothetical protein